VLDRLPDLSYKQKNIYYTIVSCNSINISVIIIIIITIITIIITYYYWGHKFEWLISLITICWQKFNNKIALTDYFFNFCYLSE